MLNMVASATARSIPRLIDFPFCCLFFSFTHRSLSRQNCPRSRCHGRKPSGQECSAGCHSGTRSLCTDEGLRMHKKRVNQTHMNIHRQANKAISPKRYCMCQSDFTTSVIKGIVHTTMKICWKCTHHQAIQRNVALYYFLTNGSSAVDGCRQNESPNSW